jgi:hypothetical protein
MCLNDKHLKTIARWMGLSIQHGKAIGDLSKDRLETGTGGVNGTPVLLGLGTKVLYINYIDGLRRGVTVDSWNESRFVLYAESAPGRLPRLTVLGRPP